MNAIEGFLWGGIVFGCAGYLFGIWMAGWATDDLARQVSQLQKDLADEKRKRKNLTASFEPK